MLEDLFRQEAQENRQRLDGQVIISSPVTVWAITGLICVIALVGIATAVFGEYVHKETVTGWLAPDRGMAQIIAQTHGVVETLYVHEGDGVDEGQPLASISIDTGLTNDTGVAESMLTIISRQRNELIERLDNIKLRYNVERRRLAGQKKGILQELDEVFGSIELQEQRIDLAEEQVENVHEAANLGYVSNLELQRSREALLTQRQVLADYKQRKIALENALRDIESQLESVPLRETAEISELQLQLAEIDRQRTEAITRGGYVLRAPVAGRVTAILAQPGEAANPARPIMTLLPAGGKLQAHLLAPTRAVGFVQQGQEVRLSYEAFPFERYGAAYGTVSSVSKTILNPDDLPFDLQVGEPVYRIIVELEEEFVLARGKKIPLQPGMLLQGDIVFDRRSLWEWMLDPLLRVTRG